MDHTIFYYKPNNDKFKIIIDDGKTGVSTSEVL